ncbi:MAG: phosphoribosyl-ATP diphosphatase [Leptospiraceae bacterium]|nr:phosphoribosyl-ATP diphosphatase [Leptospiraceae bacterium]
MSEKESLPSFLPELQAIIQSRKSAAAESSYTAKLFSKGLDKILQKVGEEAVEFIIDAKNKHKERIISEGADLLYHFLVSLAALDIDLTEIEAELQKRHAEKINANHR